jgi:single-strand DNA-binding protein
MNLVVLNGRIVKDVEIKNSSNGMAYCKFTLAVNRQKKGESDFIGCTAFGKTAELLGKYTKKGDMINVQGHIQTGNYESNGKKIYTTDIMIEKIEFLNNGGAKKDNYERITDRQRNVSEDEFPF